MTARWVTPAWTGPDSPQGPVKAEAMTETVRDTCISCGAEVDHYLGCPDDPNPDYQAEAEARGVPLPVYKGTVIYGCPACDGDLQHEGCDGYWCAACRQSWSFTQVGLYEDEDPRDD